MVSVSSFKSSSTQHDVRFVNYGPVYFKIDDKAEYALGRGYLVTGRYQGESCLVQPFGSWMLY